MPYFMTHCNGYSSSAMHDGQLGSLLGRLHEQGMFTSRQLSRRTVSMPFVSILSQLSGLVHKRPA